MKSRLGFLVISSVLFIAIPSIAVIPVLIGVGLGRSPVKLRDFFADLLGGTSAMAGIVVVVWSSVGLLHCRDKFVNKFRRGR